MRTITEPAWPEASAGNRVDRLLLGVLRLYKLVVSPYFAGSCRFHPSCADYARDAVLFHGALRGTWLAGKRLCRCHPLCAGGFDPVPLSFSVWGPPLGGPQRNPAKAGSHRVREDH